jgi:DNA polymerase-1
MDYKALGATASKSDSASRSTVAGRVLQDDTDFICYQCANLEQTEEYAFHQVLANLDKARRMAGAQTVNMHLTMGMKGGRAEMATVKPYQEKRNVNKKPELAYRVTRLREMLANHKSSVHIPIVNITQEADDSLRQMQWDCIQAHGVESSVMRSGDKDLWFLEGLHMDDLGRFYTVDGYGWTAYREVGNVAPKLIGQGTSWFWHQLVMGDGADNIPGLPTISGRLLNRYVPTKKYNPHRKAGACGEAKAVAMLKDVTTESEAAERVMEAYEETYGRLGAAEMLVEQAFLLWIRKTSKLTEIITFLRESGLNVSFTSAQIARLKAYGAKVKEQKAMS